MYECRGAFVHVCLCMCGGGGGAVYLCIHGLHAQCVKSVNEREDCSVVTSHSHCPMT